MKKKMNNKGFSLVELIVVIAIMGVLVGILAPQFIRYVEQTRKSTDVKNGQEIATVIQTAIADGYLTTDVANEVLSDTSASGAVLLSKKLIPQIPVGKSGTNKNYSVSYKIATGEVTVTYDGKQVFPKNEYSVTPTTP